MLIYRTVCLLINAEKSVFWALCVFLIPRPLLFHKTTFFTTVLSDGSPGN